MNFAVCSLILSFEPQGEKEFTTESVGNLDVACTNLIGKRYVYIEYNGNNVVMTVNILDDELIADATKFGYELAEKYLKEE